MVKYDYVPWSVGREELSVNGERSYQLRGEELSDNNLWTMGSKT